MSNIKGKVVETGLNYYFIKGEDNEIYFSHAGDIQENENLINKLKKTTLELDDEVEFTPVDPSNDHTSKRAIHIKIKKKT